MVFSAGPVNACKRRLTCTQRHSPFLHCWIFVVLKFYYRMAERKGKGRARGKKAAPAAASSNVDSSPAPSLHAASDQDQDHLHHHLIAVKLQNHRRRRCSPSFPLYSFDRPGEGGHYGMGPATPHAL